jgi:deoxyuridine 5'-triphosphate nucleotidohydrolase
MTSMSEKQCYFMGWANSGDNTDFDTNSDRSRVFELMINPLEIQDILTTSDKIEVYNTSDYNSISDEMKYHYWRGVFDRLAVRCEPDIIQIPKTNYFDTQAFYDFSGVAFNDTDPDYVTWDNINALEVLYILYIKCEFYSILHKRNLLQLDNRCHEDLEPVHFKWARSLPDAVAPSKAHLTDSGYDLTVVSKIKEVDGVCYYDTGIKVMPPCGYYFDVIGRSSISKTGWMLANNVGVIDSSYRGSIIIALVRVNPSAEEITLPMRIAQMIPRRINHLLSKEVSEEELIGTCRGEGGFGSSG